MQWSAQQMAGSDSGSNTTSTLTETFIESGSELLEFTNLIKHAKIKQQTPK